MGKRIIGLLLSFIMILGIVMIPESKAEAASTWLTDREYKEYLKLQSKCPIEGTLNVSGDKYKVTIDIDGDNIVYKGYLITNGGSAFVHVALYSVFGTDTRMSMMSGPYFGTNDYVNYYGVTDVTTYYEEKPISFTYYESSGTTGRGIANNSTSRREFAETTENLVTNVFMDLFSRTLKSEGIDISKIGFRNMESTLPDEPDEPAEPAEPVVPSDSSNNNNNGKNQNPAYSNEWINGKWYDANGNQTYAGTLSWKSNATGWWVEDTSGWYPTDKWQKIDGTWYYFKPNGYMAANEYYKGNWFNSNGSWDNRYMLRWKSDSTGWWVEDVSGWWPSSSWLKIDGYWYYFDASGYMVTNQYIDGYWIGADGVCY